MYKSNNIKNILHGFFLAIALTIAEPSTTLPLIIHHFSPNELIVGLFTSLLRGGAILVQLFAAFYAQSFKLVMPYLKRVFVARFLSWFSIGAAILLIGDKNPHLTLAAIGIGLFLFSFSAGFGSIYFNEIIAKVFTKEQRGKTMAQRQFFAALGAIVSGAVAGWVLSSFTPPQNYGYLFIISAFFMAAGLLAFSTIDEPVKEEVLKKDESFTAFLKKAANILKKDRRLQIQIATVLLSYSFLFSFAFVILEAKRYIELTGWLIGGFITIQMLGALVGNLVWNKMAPRYKTIMILSFWLSIAAFLALLSFKSFLSYFTLFFLLGMAIDGFKIASMNLLFEISPQKMRPIYVALQNNLTSIGLFFAVPGGLVLQHFGYNVLYALTLLLLGMGLIFATRLEVG